MIINAKTKLCCIIGNPVEHSLSPIMHNAGYEALRLNFAYMAFNVKELKEAIAGLRAIGVQGIVVTVPHKIEVMQYIDEIDETAQKIGAINTIVNENGVLTGTNTDWIGAIEALKKRTQLARKKVAVLGAGGAARAVCYGLMQEGAQVAVFNRTISKAQELVKHLKLENAYSLDEVEKIKSAEIIINTTSVGMESDISPLLDRVMQKDHIVFDIVYTPLKTKLIQQAEKVGAQVVYGDDMVLYGGLKQFEIFTGEKAPVDIMKKALTDELKKINK